MTCDEIHNQLVFTDVMLKLCLNQVSSYLSYTLTRTFLDSLNYFTLSGTKH